MKKTLDCFISLGLITITFVAICFSEVLVICSHAAEKPLSEKDQTIIQHYNLSTEEQQIYQKLLKIKLIHRPIWDRDEGMKEFRVTDLSNPLEGEFNILECEHESKSLRISTGFSNRVKWADDKIEVWLAARFLVEKNINGSASRYKSIFPSEWPSTAQFGIIWSRRELENREGCFDYLTCQTLEELCDDHLYAKWRSSQGYSKIVGQGFSELGTAYYRHFKFVL